MSTGASGTRVAVTGVSGRMGALLVKMVRAAPDLVLAGGTDHPRSTALGQDVGLVAQAEATGLVTRGSLAEVLDGCDVVIDFTTPEATLEHAALCARAHKALVVGTTGLSVEAKASLLEAARHVPMVVAPNMSVGVNLMIEVAAQLAFRLGEDFDVEVLEAHHRHKKDAPSGTAVRLAEELVKALGRTPGDVRTSRVGQVGARPRQEIGVSALRGGDVVGEHTVFYFGDGERVELTHRATSREHFGRGALRAARWVVRQVPGLYDMAHVLRG
jgi:4-hydroxy-tetrahydrodipicolinate reductase